MLVRVWVAFVNPVIWKARQGHLDVALPAVFPAFPGWDLAGVVVRTGPAVPEFSEGDEVIGYVREDVLSFGTCAEYVAAPVRTLAPYAAPPRLRGGGRPDPRRPCRVRGVRDASPRAAAPGRMPSPPAPLSRSCPSTVSVCRLLPFASSRAPPAAPPGSYRHGAQSAFVDRRTCVRRPPVPDDRLADRFTACLIAHRVAAATATDHPP
ncbi:hypothetical protein SALBM217S_03106 [Streptomyces griseoloalbus]